MADKEVRYKFSLDDVASAVLDKIKTEFTQTGQEADKAKDHAMTFFTQMAATAAGVSFMPMIHEITGFAHGFVEAATEVQNFEQNMGSMIAYMQDVPWEDANKQAQNLTSKLNDIGIEGGQSIRDVKEGFNTLLELSGATAKNIDQNVKAVTDMTTVANALDIPVSNIAREFSLMEEGTLRTRGQLFQLLRHTGIFGKDVHHAAEGWAKLTNQQRADSLNSALGQMASRMGRIPPTFADATKSLENIWDVIKQTVGQPIIEELVPVFDQIAKDFSRNEKDIKSVAQTMGRTIAEGVKVAAHWVQEGFDYIKTHIDEIKDGIMKSFEYAKEVVNFILEHKEALAFAFGASKVMGPAQAALAAGAGGGLMGGALSTLAVTSIIVSGSLVVDSIKSLAETAKPMGHAGDVDAMISTMHQMMLQGRAGTDEYEEMEKQVKYLSEMNDNIQGFTARGGHAAEFGTAVGDRKEDEFAKETRSRLQDATQGAIQFQQITDGLADMVSAVNSDGLVDALNDASNKHKTANINAMANIIGDSSAMQNAFVQSSKLTDDAFGSLIDVMEKRGGDLAQLADAMKAERETNKSLLSNNANHVQVNVGGGNTFNIKQDFRDQDPDRVATVFRRDIGNAAINQTASQFGSFFGAGTR